MASTPSTTADPDINRIISYWFEGEDLIKKWFMGGPVDTEIREQFGDLVEKARASQLKSWEDHPLGALALILLLDQFPRNIFRGSPLSYSSDPVAAEVATRAIARGFNNRQITDDQQNFLYLPLMHAENLLSQVTSVALFENRAARCEPGSKAKSDAEKSMSFAAKYRYIILRFGRFPSRNEVLGRTSTEEEIQYLKENPSGF